MMSRSCMVHLINSRSYKQRKAVERAQGKLKCPDLAGKTTRRVGDLCFRRENGRPLVPGTGRGNPECQYDFVCGVVVHIPGGRAALESKMRGVVALPLRYLHAWVWFPQHRLAVAELHHRSFQLCDTLHVCVPETDSIVTDASEPAEVGLHTYQST